MDSATTDSHVHRAWPFLAAFNDIESLLRGELQAPHHESFRQLVYGAVKDKLLSKDQAQMLIDFAELRNALAHGAYDEDFEPIAEPNEKTVRQIVALRKMLHTTPPVMQVLPPQKVRIFKQHHPIVQLLSSRVNKYPIYKGDIFQRLLIPADIIDYLRDSSSQWTIPETLRVEDIIAQSAKHRPVVFLDQLATVPEVITALNTIGESERPQAVIITAHGRRDEKAIRLITASEAIRLAQS
ncbi:hypothetical protein N7326_00905 [Corynebacterium sp. ES2794-CONJ1]|uniref:hypothetical protein n=1 Tax=Corynebacterium sp. ES2794-CONJ1 TaxID=2980553 RepID=UPI0021D99C37|nr:hypothetical protein [Corynebacterium sp. ES2794-CONJ1]MCU9518433.1 hypothetical protein [Corynebacterium sp. ES2794-CONJ1]